MLLSAKIAPLFEYSILERFWRDADELGFHAIYDYDHFYGLRDNQADTFEGWTMLAAMAAVTSRARVGCLVTGVTYRNPAVLAKMAVSVDHISGGRLEFGIGAAWHQGEHEGYGIPFPSAATRIAMLDEACQILQRLWSEDRVDHEGPFWKLTGAFCNPKPLQQRIPMVLGGVGKKRTLRVVAKHADEWNFPGGREIEAGPSEFAGLSRVLDEHCEAIGRDPKQIRRSVQLLMNPEQPDQVNKQIALLEQYEEHGAQHAVLAFVSPPTRGLLESLAPR